MARETGPLKRDGNVGGRITGGCAGALILLGITVLVGWFLGWSLLTTVMPGLPSMKPNTALVFILAGLSLRRFAEELPAPRDLLLSRLCALGMIVLGGQTLCQHVLDVDWRWDGWWFSDLRAAGAGRMAHATAIASVLAGTTLVCPRGRFARDRISPWGAVCAGLIGLLGVAGFLYDVSLLHAVTAYSSMAVHTAVGFVVLAIGVLFAREGDASWQLLRGRGIGGAQARLVLPFLLGTPVALGWLVLIGFRAGLYPAEFGLALSVIGAVLVSGIVVWASSGALERVDRQRLDSLLALRASEHAARQTVEGLPQLVWTCRPDGPCDYLSPQWVRYTGLPAAGQLGFGWLDQLHPEDRQRVIDHWQSTAAKGAVFEVEFRIRRHDGEHRWFRTMAQPLRDEQGRVVKWFGTNTDIDDLKRAELSQSRLAAIVDSSDDAIVGKTVDGFVTSWNRGAEKLFGYSAAEMEGQSITRIVPEDRVDEDRRILAELAAGRQIRHFRTWRVRKDKRRVAVSVTVSPIVDANGRVVGASKVARDITDQLEAEDKLRRTNDDLELRVRRRTAELETANAALREGRAQLEEAQRVAHLGSWSFDVVTGEVQWSAELFRIVGLDPADRPPNYQTQEGMFAPESWSRLTAAIDRSVRSGDGYELELEVIRPDGQRRWAVARAEAHVGPLGRVDRLTGTFLDISALHAARVESQRLAARLELATQVGEVGVWEWDVVADSLTWDDTMRRLYGVAEALRYLDWLNAVIPEDRESAAAAVTAALEVPGLKFDHHFRIRRTDGSLRDIHAIGGVERDTDEKPLRMVGLNRDVTRELDTERRLRANEALLGQFVKHAPAAIAMLDDSMRYLQVSDRWRLDYKLDEQSLSGRSHYEVFPDQPASWRAIHERVLAGAVDRCDQAPFPRADGSVEWLRWEVRPWSGPDGSIGGLIMFTQVITEQKNLELELRRGRAELERSNRELEQFAYVASHDLQEPLRAVIGCVQLLEARLGDRLEAKDRELVRHIVDGGARMQRLILDLLAYSRVGSGMVNAAPLALDEALDEALKNLAQIIADSGATLRRSERLPSVRADRGQMVQLFQNLVGNALKYRDVSRAPVVEIAAASGGEQEVRVMVRDNGIGIEPRHHERIFLIFQRLHSRSEYPGTGLGLALCKKIVERHGGNIGVDSRPGQGSTFFFTLKP